jgi:hypothetical protein
MTERTINQAELKAVLDAISTIGHPIFNTIMGNAFPPLFIPKEGEIVRTSEYEDFRNCRVRVFSHININNWYECFCDAHITGSTVPWKYAKPQTPTQKGED